MAKKELRDLKHTKVDLKYGGKVFVLDTGAVIDAESAAMLMALHSRSPNGIERHLEVLAEKGPEEFMQTYYVGYNHKSIGDCGSTYIFIEDVSMLAAKAVQDNPLYSGQEVSTRYVDFSSQAFLNPARMCKSPKEESWAVELLERQRLFYLEAMEPTNELLKETYPRQEGEKKGEYSKAIKARAFDIARGLLPAGASTNLAWHTNLRQAADKILFLRHHPLSEVRDIADGLEEALLIHHPNSFSSKRYDATEEYQDLIAEFYFYHDPASPEQPVVDASNINRDMLSRAQRLFQERPARAELPKYLGQIGVVGAQFRLDYGSFRDVQRHRALTQRMPLLTAELGFNSWYVNSLPAQFQERLPVHLNAITQGVEQAGMSREEAQYFLPMGYNTSNRFTGDLPATVYMVELRDTRFVHPTLQKVANIIGTSLEDDLGIRLNRDAEPSRFDVRRGQHDIVERQQYER